MPAITDHRHTAVPRTVASAVATVIALGGGLVAAQPAGAAVAGPSASSSQGTSASSVNVHSVGHPKASAKYADALITAWAADAHSHLEKRAAPAALETLAAHGRKHVKEWKRIAADGDEKTSTAVYSNRTTGALLVVRVDNRTAESNADHAVRSVRFTS